MHGDRFGAHQYLAGLVSVLVLGLIVALYGEISVGETLQELSYRDEPFDMHFVDNGNGWVVGDQGLMLETKDGGNSWLRHKRLTIKPLFGVDFVDLQTGWVVGAQGSIWRTKDGGQQWEPQESGTDKHLMAVEFVDENRGVAAGAFGVIVRTADGGASWHAYPVDWEKDLVEVLEATGLAEPHLYDVSFVGECGVIAGENGVILRSTDGGATWTLVQGGLMPPVFSACYADCSTGWAVGQNGFVMTTTDGTTWKKVEVPAKENLTRIRLAGAHGVIVGDYGTVLMTGNGGATWQRMPGDFGGRWLMDACLFTSSNTKAAIIGAGFYKRIELK